MYWFHFLSISYLYSIKFTIKLCMFCIIFLHPLS